MCLFDFFTLKSILTNRGLQNSSQTKIKSNSILPGKHGTISLHTETNFKSQVPSNFNTNQCMEVDLPANSDLCTANSDLCGAPAPMEVELVEATANSNPAPMEVELPAKFDPEVQLSANSDACGAPRVPANFDPCIDNLRRSGRVPVDKQHSDFIRLHGDGGVRLKSGEKRVRLHEGRAGCVAAHANEEAVPKGVTLSVCSCDGECGLHTGRCITADGMPGVLSVREHLKGSTACTLCRNATKDKVKAAKADEKAAVKAAAKAAKADAKAAAKAAAKAVKAAAKAAAKAQKDATKQPCSCDGDCGEHTGPCLTEDGDPVYLSAADRRNRRETCASCRNSYARRNNACRVCDKSWAKCVCLEEAEKEAEVGDGRDKAAVALALITDGGTVHTIVSRTQGQRSIAATQLHHRALVATLVLAARHLEFHRTSPESTNPVDSNLLEHLHSYCVEVEQKNAQSASAFHVAALIEYLGGRIYNSVRLCLFSLEVDEGTPGVVDLMVDCLGRMNVEPNLLTGSLRFMWSRGSKVGAPSMLSFAGGESRVEMYSRSPSQEEASNGVTACETLRGILHVPVLMQHLLVETLLMSEEAQAAASDLDALIRGTPPKDYVSAIVKAVEAVWACDPTGNPDVRLCHWFSRRHLIHGTVERTEDASTKSLAGTSIRNAVEAKLTPGLVGASMDAEKQPMLVLNRGSLGLWLQAFKHLQANPDNALEMLKSTGTSLSEALDPIRQHEAHAAMRQFQDATAADTLDLSCTCASCGLRVPATALTLDTGDADVIDYYSHENCCRTGWPLENVELVSKKETGGWVRRTRGRGGGRDDEDGMSSGCEDEENMLEDFIDVGDNVVVYPNGDTDGGYDGRVTCMLRDGSVGVRFLPAITDPPIPPACPLTVALRELQKCGDVGTTCVARMGDPRIGLTGVQAAEAAVVAAAKLCPYGSQLHGLHVDSGGGLFVLLREVDWTSNRLQNGEQPSTSDVVRTWRPPSTNECQDASLTGSGATGEECKSSMISSVGEAGALGRIGVTTTGIYNRGGVACSLDRQKGVSKSVTEPGICAVIGGSSGRATEAATIPSSEFYVCDACFKCLRPTKKNVAPKLPKFALGRCQLQIVPPCEVACISKRDPREIRLLAKPNMILHQMVSVFRTNSLIIRLLSSSHLDRLHNKSGNGVSQDAAKPKVIVGDGPDKDRLQRASRRHIISFRNCIDELQQKVAAGIVDGPVSKEEVMKTTKVVLCGPAYSKKQLVAAALAGKTFDVSQSLLRRWLEFLEAFHLPEYYGPAAREAAVARRKQDRAYAAEDARTPSASGHDDNGVSETKIGDCSKVNEEEDWGVGLSPDEDFELLAERCVIYSSDNKDEAARFLRGVKGEGTAYSASHQDLPREGEGPTGLHTETSGAICMSGDAFSEMDMIVAGLKSHDRDLRKEHDYQVTAMKCTSCDTSGIECHHCACANPGHHHGAGDCHQTASGLRPSRTVDELCAPCAQALERDRARPRQDLKSEMPDIAMVRGAQPVSEFDEADLLSGANAPLFPNGRGLYKDRRREQQYSLNEWRRHLACLSNRVFAEHHSFFFDVAYVTSNPELYACIVFG